MEALQGDKFLYQKEVNMKKVILFFLFVSNTWPGIDPKIVVEGRVSSFDKNNVTLYRDDGEVVVPRSSISKKFKVEPGAYVHAVIESDFILREIEKNNKKQKKQVQKKKK